jgi:hypothetical protein
MLLALFRTRIKALVVTLLIGLAAPRVARVLRGFGQRRQAAGGGRMSTTVPLGAASALEKVAVWARPPKEKKRSRFGRR